MDRVAVNVVIYHFLNWWVQEDRLPLFVFGSPDAVVVADPDEQFCTGGALLDE